MGRAGNHQAEVWETAEATTVVESRQPVNQCNNEQGIIGEPTPRKKGEAVVLPLIVWTYQSRAWMIRCCNRSFVGHARACAGHGRQGLLWMTVAAKV